jgi:hypothetical protein
MLVRAMIRCAVPALAAAGACLVVAGCTLPFATPTTGPQPSAVATQPPPAAATIATEAPPAPETPLATAAAVDLDPRHASLARSHKGATIGVMIVGSSARRTDADAAAAKARAALSEFDTYFVVDRSDHYAGMTPGLWVAFEAHKTVAQARDSLSQATSWLEGRGIRGYAKGVTVRCSDRFVIFETAVPGSD